MMDGHDEVGSSLMDICPAGVGVRGEIGPTSFGGAGEGLVVAIRGRGGI